MGIRLAVLKMPFMARRTRPSRRDGRLARPARAQRAIGHAATGAQATVPRGTARGACSWSTPRSSVYDARQATFGTMYIATVGKIRMLSQRLAKAAQQASQGNREAFKQLRESRDEFAAQMKLLLAGGVAARRVAACDARACAPGARRARRGVAEERERNAALVIARGDEPGRRWARGARHQREQPRAAGTGRRDGGAQRAERRQRAPERDHRAAHDAGAAHGEERQHACWPAT